MEKWTLFTLRGESLPRCALCIAWWAGPSGLPAMAEAIALAADRDGRGAVKQPVEQRRGERRVGEDLVPLPEALVARQEDRLLHLVAYVYEFEETGRVVPLEGLVSDLVEDEERGARAADCPR